MEVILLEDVEGLGKAGDLKTVKDGYARNYLIPRGLAVIADKKKKRDIEHKKRMVEEIQKRRLKTADALKKRLEELSITIQAVAGEEDKLHGAITKEKIAEAINAQGISLDKEQVLLDEPIKTLGIFNVRIKILKDIEATVKVWVVRK
jgi:large subunit ribosomal protein L9